MPTLFYTACLTAFVLQSVGKWTLIFAWAYVAGRLVQSAIHMTYNNPAHRGIGFILGALAMMAVATPVILGVWLDAFSGYLAQPFAVAP